MMPRLSHSAGKGIQSCSKLEQKNNDAIKNLAQMLPNSHHALIGIVTAQIKVKVKVEVLAIALLT